MHTGLHPSRSEAAPNNLSQPKVEKQYFCIFLYSFSDFLGMRLARTGRQRIMHNGSNGDGSPRNVPFGGISLQ
jgi:hypothetical protein